MFIWGLLGCTEIEIDSRTIKIRKSLFNLGKQTHGKITNITRVEQEITSYDIRGEEISYCTFYGEKRMISFGAMIRLDEQKWLIEEISDFLKQNKKTSSN